MSNEINFITVFCSHILLTRCKKNRLIMNMENQMCKNQNADRMPKWNSLIFCWYKTSHTNNWGHKLYTIYTIWLVSFLPSQPGICSRNTKFQFKMANLKTAQSGFICLACQLELSVHFFCHLLNAFQSKTNITRANKHLLYHHHHQQQQQWYYVYYVNTLIFNTTHAHEYTHAHINTNTYAR